MKLLTSPLNTYLEIEENGDSSKKMRLELVRAALTGSPITDSQKLEEAVKKYTKKNDMPFRALHKLFDEDFSEEDSKTFFDSVLPKMIALALRMPELIKAPIPLLKKGMNHSISLTQEQAACLLANAFFCTFPGRSVERKNTDYPEINFRTLFSCSSDHVVEKVKCILHYFKRVCEDMPTGVLTFQRRFIRKDDFPDFEQSTTKLSSVNVTMSADQTIEEGAGMLQVDFANRYLGGGVLGWGCVQEEIRFVINPEMILGMLFCESMGATEAIVMTGCEQFSKYRGYSNSFKWAGKFNDDTPRDDMRRRKAYVVAIDAYSFHKPHLQFKEFAKVREAQKAFVGFFHDPQDATDPIPVCSGNWGCGAFRGNKQLKALIQIIACCLNRRDLLYCTFGDHVLGKNLANMAMFLKKHEITVGKWISFQLNCVNLIFILGTLWKYLRALQESDVGNGENEIFKFIYKQHYGSLAAKEEGSETEESETKGDSECSENPPAKKQRISEKDDEAENEILASSVASLNEKLTDIAFAADEIIKTEGTVLDDHKIEQTVTAVVEEKELSSVAGLNEKSTDIDAAADETIKTEDKLSEKTALEQAETAVDNKKKFKITDFFKPK